MRRRACHRGRLHARGRTDRCGHARRLIHERPNPVDACP
jgi:hypothetical protein